MRLKLKGLPFLFLSLMAGTLKVYAQSDPYNQITVTHNANNTNYVLTNFHQVTYSQLPLWIKIASISTVLFSALVLIKIIPFFVVRLRGIRDNKNRDSIYDSIKNKPGQTLTEVSENSKVNRGTLRYHLSMLLKGNKIVILKKGKSFYLFPKISYSVDSNDIWLYLKNDTEKRILYSIMDKPGLTNTELSAMLGLNKSNTHKYLKKYAKNEIIEFKEDGKSKRCYLMNEAGEILRKYRNEQIKT
jgi:predicted transcriptional regulator